MFLFPGLSDMNERNGMPSRTGVAETTARLRERKLDNNSKNNIMVY